MVNKVRFSKDELRKHKMDYDKVYFQIYYKERVIFKRMAVAKLIKASPEYIKARREWLDKKAQLPILLKNAKKNILKPQGNECLALYKQAVADKKALGKKLCDVRNETLKQILKTYSTKELYEMGKTIKENSEAK